MARRPAVHRQGRQVHLRPHHEPEVRRVHQGRLRRDRRHRDRRRRTRCACASRSRSPRSSPRGATPTSCPRTSSTASPIPTPRSSTPRARSAPAPSSFQAPRGRRSPRAARQRQVPRLGAPALERVIFKYIPDLTVLYTQFKTGAVDVTGMQGISAEFFAEAKSLPGVTVPPARHAVGRVHLLQSRQAAVQGARRPPGALRRAWTSSAIIDQIYYGVPQAGGGLPAAPTRGRSTRSCRSQEYNPDKARQILDESGWKPGADGIRAKDGVQLSFTNSTTAGNKLREQTQALVQQNWQGDRRRHADQQHAGRRRVGGVLRQVQVRHAPRRHPGDHRRRSRLPEPHPQQVHPRRDGLGAQRDAVREPAGRQAPRGRRARGRPGQAPGALP